ncbi:FxLD family lanthipeptide [Nocardiopsis quinghaiensis]|uniref:FxLD family lanthipeptide n=1 Tax=Nocardiopsis quinghaiensis TaxID=464995 RepID=UPI00123BF75C|nr:FxLD family lanthipeptide [Nocardiopsis quinghaiensis]
MAVPQTGAPAFADEFSLDIQVVEESTQVLPGLLRSTSDNCGSTCDGTACVSFVSDPA